MKMRYYFDYNATTPLPPFVQKVMGDALKKDYKNASSMHSEGRASRQVIEDARERMAAHLGCKPQEIIFNSGATEGNVSVLNSSWISRPANRNVILVSSVEHNALLKPAEALIASGAVLRKIPVSPEGNIDLTKLSQLIDENVFLVSVMLANNETGMIFPVQAIAQLAHDKGALFHTDAACGIGKLKVNFRELDADFLTMGAHKFYGPKGVGAMLVKACSTYLPLILGGTHERGLRAGTENVLGISGMAAGLDYAMEDFDEEVKRMTHYRQRIKDALKEIHPSILFHESRFAQLPGTLHLGFRGIHGQTLLAALDLEGVAASFGAACMSGSLEVSRVILDMGVDPVEAQGSIRLSFGKMTTQKDIDGLLKIFERVLGRMNFKSPASQPPLSKGADNRKVGGGI